MTDNPQIMYSVVFMRCVLIFAGFFFLFFFFLVVVVGEGKGFTFRILCFSG
jgi:hypothetical protein